MAAAGKEWRWMMAMFCRHNLLLTEEDMLMLLCRPVGQPRPGTVYPYTNYVSIQRCAGLSTYDADGQPAMAQRSLVSTS